MTILNYQLVKNDRTTNKKKGTVGIYPDNSGLFTFEEITEQGTKKSLLRNEGMERTIRKLVTDVTANMFEENIPSNGSLGTMSCLVYTGRHDNFSTLTPSMIKEVRIIFYPNREIKLKLQKAETDIVCKYTIIVDPKNVIRKKQRIIKY